MNIPKPYDYIKFQGKSVVCYGYVLEVNKTCIKYVRDSLTEWIVDVPLIIGVWDIIPEQQFIDQVYRKMEASTKYHVVDNIDRIRNVLKAYKENHNLSLDQKISILYGEDKDISYSSSTQ